MKRIVILLATASAALLIPLPQVGRAGVALLDLLHAPCFALLAALIYLLLKPVVGKNRESLLAAACWCVLVIFGIGSEYAQEWFGRRATFPDALANVAGVTAGLLIASSLGCSQTRWRWAIALILLIAAILKPALTLVDVAIARWQFPQLASFEQPLETWRWQARSSDLSRAKQHATDGDWSLQVDLKPAQYPGVHIDMFQSDWSEYDTLALDITWVQEHLHSASDFERFDVIVKIEDFDHKGDYFDRFHRRVTLAPGKNEIRISLIDVASAPRDRTMDMTQIRILQVFAIDLKRSKTLFIDNIRLERE